MSDEDRMECMDSDIREWFEDLTPERRAVITARMEKQIIETVGDWNGDTDPVLVETAFVDVASTMYTQDMLEELVEDRLVCISGVDDDGNLMYEAVEGHG